MHGGRIQEDEKSRRGAVMKPLLKPQILLTFQLCVSITFLYSFSQIDLWLVGYYFCYVVTFANIIDA